jgi:Tol biopolymer transport system component
MPLVVLSAMISNQPAAAALLLGSLAVGLVACAAQPSDAPTPAPTTGDAAPALISASSTLAYQWVLGGTEHILTMNGDGSKPHLVPLDVDGNLTHPDWSPDGTKFTFGVDGGGDHREVWVANVDGSDAHVVVPCADACFGTDYPSWSPDGTSIVYSFFDGPGPFAGPPESSTIRVLDVATGASRIVTASQPGELVDNARWSRDGSMIVMQIDRFDEQGTEIASFIGVAASAGGAFTRLTDGAMFGMYPDWSPTADLIVFCTYDLGPFQTTTEASNLYTIHPDGTGLTALTDFPRGGDRATQPTWTRDGTGVFITWEVDGVRNGAVVPAEGGTPLRISDVLATHVRQAPE